MRKLRPSQLYSLIHYNNFYVALKFQSNSIRLQLPKCCINIKFATVLEVGKKMN